ncbi:hypothetical protein [Streptomyces sp. NPDC050560]
MRRDSGAVHDVASAHLANVGQQERRPRTASSDVESNIPVPYDLR